MSALVDINAVLNERTSRTDFLPSWSVEGLERVLLNSKMYFRHCYAMAASKSHDPNTQVGALVVNSTGNIIGAGTNRFPRGYNSDNSVEEHRCSEDACNREIKYKFMEHAERNAIYNAFSNIDHAHSYKDPIMFCPFFSCIDCSRAIIESGIQLVVGHKKIMQLAPERWKSSIADGRRLFDLAGVKFLEIDCDILDARADIVFDGKLFSP